MQIKDVRQALDAAGYPALLETIGELVHTVDGSSTVEELLFDGCEDAADVGRRAEVLARVGGPLAAAVFVSGSTDDATCVVYTRDQPGVFSYLCGTLAARGFDIQRGHIASTGNGFAVDQFAGAIEWAADLRGWAEALQTDLDQLLGLLEKRPPDVQAVREQVVADVVRTLSSSPETDTRLLPISVTTEIGEDATLVDVRSQDTPFFLFSLSSALLFQDVSIVAVEIDTRASEIHDRFWVRKVAGGAVTSDRDIERITLSVLVTKQFTHALDQAADPRGAFMRFEDLVRNVATNEGSRTLRDLLSDPDAQRELARLLGASDFLWEDFIRLQYESLLPMLARSKDHRALSTPKEAVEEALDAQLAAAPDWDGVVAALNEFKDRESFLIDADHILGRDSDFFFLSHRLTHLAELVVRRAFSHAWQQLSERFGTPGSAAGLPAGYAVFGLGKLGGRALGYASDIELMVVYSDQGYTSARAKSGQTDPDSVSISNREFFEKLVQKATGAIQSRREAIFEIDLRLRPYGADGPKAVHLDRFIEYFGAGGEAHSAERLALIRLRWIAGDAALGNRVERIRDTILYESSSIDVVEIRELREFQAEQKASGPAANAKFSPGALVDLEYNVQLLQIEEGQAHRQIRNPGIHATLTSLSELGTIDGQEASSMITAYRFLRNLINGLRMLRGNAQDLFLPDFESPEAQHLARRMGYTEQENLSAAEQLRVDFDVETAAVRGFVERHLGQDALPKRTTGNPADLVLSDAIGTDRISSLLGSAGVRNPARGIINIRRMAGMGRQREAFARLLVLVWDDLKRSGDPDMALNNWDRFTEHVSDKEQFFSELLAQPRRLELMMIIFAGSQFLSDTLIRTPGFLTWLSDPDVVARERSADDMLTEIGPDIASAGGRTEKLDVSRRFRRREMLRIGTRDICLSQDFLSVVGEISDLATAIIQAHLSDILRSLGGAGRFCVLAFGKLGGRELNYSSDIDLLAMYEADPEIEGQEATATRIMKQLVRDLSDFTVEGQAYRVDVRLRPYGNAGRLVYSRESLERYYGHESALWEIQALLKLNPVAGDMGLGREFLDNLREPCAKRIQSFGASAVVETVRHLRERAVNEHRAGSAEHGSAVGVDIKNGEGGIRDIEFLVQALQLLHQDRSPALLTGNTLVALHRLEEAGILSSERVASLKEDYLLLRRIEHFLQVYDDQQLHSVPAEPEAQAKLARVVLGDGGSASEIVRKTTETLTRVREQYTSVVASR